MLLYLQQAGVGGLTVAEAGTQDILQKELAVFVQDSWQVSPRLTLDLGLRWESQIQPSLITPIPELFYQPFIGQSRDGQEFPGDGTIPSDWTMFQPRLTSSVKMRRPPGSWDRRCQRDRRRAPGAASWLLMPQS